MTLPSATAKKQRNYIISFGNQQASSLFDHQIFHCNAEDRAEHVPNYALELTSTSSTTAVTTIFFFF